MLIVSLGKHVAHLEDLHFYRPLPQIKITETRGPNTPPKSKQTETKQNIALQGKTMPYVLLQ